MINRRTLLTSAAAIAVAPHFLSSSASEAATRKNIAVMAKVIDDLANGFDPAEAYEFSTVEVCGNLYRALVTLDPSDPTKLVGDLAETWDISPDGLTLTFHLRKGAVFESGNPVTAEDAAYSLRRVVKLNAAASVYLTQFGWTKDNVDALIRPAGTDTLVVTLPIVQASGILLSSLSAIGLVVEKAVVQAHEVNGDFGNAWLRTHSAGTGSYRLVGWQASDHIILEANPNAAVKPQVHRLVIRHVADSATQLLLLQKGDVDVARDLGSDQLKSIADNTNLALASVDSLNLIYLQVNMALPQFQKPQVLQAIKWAIDYDAIAKNITPNMAIVWQQFLPKGMPGAISDNPFKKDVAKAKALLAEAGYPEGFSVTLDYFANWPFGDIAQAIQADLAAIGIQLNLLAAQRSQVYTKWRARKSDMVMSRGVADYPDPNALAQVYCSNPDNSDAAKHKNPAWNMHFADSELTAAVDAGAKEIDETKRAEIYEKMQRDFLERGNAMIMLQQKEIAVQGKGVTGLSLGTVVNYTRYAGITKA